jgi:phosphoribosylanthranilate isomerase
MNITHIKICGITRVEDAMLAAQFGADAIGLVFYAKSPRCVTPENANAIIKSLPPFITAVGLFVDATVDEVNKIIKTVPVNLLQLHGDEPPELANNYNMPYIKAIRMNAEVDLVQQCKNYQNAKGILVDAHHAYVKGGSGTTFDWDLIPQNLSKPIILAGGLNSANVSEAIAKIKPYAVDVSSGVESTPGIKDPAKLISFMEQVHHANC